MRIVLPIVFIFVTLALAIHHIIVHHPYIASVYLTLAVIIGLILMGTIE